MAVSVTFYIYIYKSDNKDWIKELMNNLLFQMISSIEVSLREKRNTSIKN